MLKFLTDPAPIDRRPAGQVVASETYLVAYTQRPAPPRSAPQLHATQRIDPERTFQ